MSEWYDWCKANHVCYRCGKVRADEGYTTCLACRMALRERKKELRRDHINPSEIRSRQRQREQEPMMEAYTDMATMTGDDSNDEKVSQ